MSNSIIFKGKIDYHGKRVDLIPTSQKEVQDAIYTMCLSTLVDADNLGGVVSKLDMGHGQE